MTLHNPALERALRRRVRAEIRASPALRREHRRHKKARRYSSGSIGRWLVAAWLLAVIFVSRGHQVSFTGQIGIVTCFATVLVFAQADALLGFLYRSADLLPLFHLPATDAFIFRWEWRKFLRESFWTWVIFYAAYGLLFSESQLGAGGWVLLGVGAAAQAATVTGLAMLLVAWRPSPFYGNLRAVAATLAIFGTIFQSLVAPYFFAAIDRAAPVLNCILPAGWISCGLNEMLSGHGNWTVLLFVAPLGVIGAAIPLTWRHLLKTYHLVEQSKPGIEEDINVGPEELRGNGPGPPSGLTEVLDSLRAGVFLEPLSFNNAGTLERLFAAWLTRREASLVELMLDKVPRWSKSWMWAAGVMCAGLAAGRWWQLGAAESGQEAWLVYAVMGAGAALFILPIAGSFRRCFLSWFMSGIQVAVYAGFPVGYHEISRVIFKGAVVRLVVALPLVVGYAAAAYGLLGLAPAAGAWVGLKTAWVVLAAQPGIAALRFSASTNDTRRFNVVGLVLLGTGIPAGFGFLGLSAALFLMDGSATWISAVALPLVSYGFFLLYGSFFNRCRFDLMNVPTQH